MFTRIGNIVTPYVSRSSQPSSQQEHAAATSFHQTTPWADGAGLVERGELIAQEKSSTNCTYSDRALHCTHACRLLDFYLMMGAHACFPPLAPGGPQELAAVDSSAGSKLSGVAVAFAPVSIGPNSRNDHTFSSCFSVLRLFRRYYSLIAGTGTRAVRGFLGGKTQRVFVGFVGFFFFVHH